MLLPQTNRVVSTTQISRVDRYLVFMATESINNDGVRDCDKWIKYLSYLIRLIAVVLFVLNHVCLCHYNKSILPILYELTTLHSRCRE